MVILLVTIYRPNVYNYMSSTLTWTSTLMFFLVRISDKLIDFDVQRSSDLSILVDFPWQLLYYLQCHGIMLSFPVTWTNDPHSQMVTHPTTYTTKLA